MKILFITLMSIIPVMADNSPANSARLWLRLPDGAPALTDVTTRTGTVSTLGNAAEGSSSHDISFPIRWWSWTHDSITFTSPVDGKVEIHLNGPWTAGPDGKPMRQEILWDDLSIEGAHLANPGFEEITDGKFSGWNSSYGNPLALDEWPLDAAKPKSGKHLAATWHDRPLSQMIEVKANQPVTLSLSAMGASPQGFVPLQKLGQDTHAHRELRKIKRGVNLGNCWEAAPPYTWGIRFTTEDIDRIAAEGFDHIRVPIGWHFFLSEKGGDMEISESLLADLEPVLRRALEKNLHVLINWHHFHDLTNDPDAHQQKFIDGWKVIANHFKDWPDQLWLELLNEPRDAMTTARVNVLHAETLKAVRRIDQNRLIFLSPGNWGAIREIDALQLPANDERLVVTVHNYDPHPFTHQGADWVDLKGFTGVRYPGPPTKPLVLDESLKNHPGLADFVDGYNTLPSERNPSSSREVERLLQHAHEWSVAFGRPIHLGEFGAINDIDPESRARYTRDVRDLAEARQIPWTLWDWKARFGYWDSETNQPVLREALFGE